MNKKVVIIGGVAGGASTAARLRRNDENAQILILEKGPYISFANCGLPYHVGGAIPRRENLLLVSPERMRERFNIEVRTGNEVTAIDRNAKKVLVREVDGGRSYEEPYDILVLAPGAQPVSPAIPGIDGEGIFTIWSIPQMDDIMGWIEQKQPRHAVVVGGGYVGIEMAESLRERGLAVSLVEMMDQVLGPLDYDIAQWVHRELADGGVDLRLDDRVVNFEKGADGIRVRLNSGAVIDTGLVVLAMGIRPRSELARQAGLALNDRGGIVVSEKMQTSDPAVYAVGDAVQVIDPVSGKPAMIPLAGPANKQGRIAANVIAGIEDSYAGTLGASVVKVFSMTAAAVGRNSKQLKDLGMARGRDYEEVIVRPMSHAGYYPGASPLTLKVLFEKSGRILGAQAVGRGGVTKRIDVIATAMKLGAKVTELTRLELCYAPPYGSAKDPVNMAGYVAENLLNGNELIYWDEIEGLDPDTTTILDVRTEPEHRLGYIAGSVDIPIDELRERVNELPNDKDVAVYCAVGQRAYYAQRILKQQGYRVRNLTGGYSHYATVTGDYTQQQPEDTDKMKGVTTMEENDIAISLELDACGLQCPGPILQVYKAMDSMSEGQVVSIRATDPGFVPDARAWCRRTGNTFISSEDEGNAFHVLIQKGSDCPVPETDRCNILKGKTMVVFDGDMDKAMAAFIIANGAAAMGSQVTMFFTFWGLNVLRKGQRIKVKKGFMEKMFGMMMPRGVDKLKISRMNMAGMGTVMMKKVMRKKNVSSLQELMESAMKNGVRIVACTMSMDVMGITKEELVDGIEYAGVASYLGAADEANVNLFI